MRERLGCSKTEAPSKLGRGELPFYPSTVLRLALSWRRARGDWHPTWRHGARYWHRLSGRPTMPSTAVVMSPSTGDLGLDLPSTAIAPASHGGRPEPAS